MQSYKDLRVWQQSVNLCVDIYSLTEKFPKEESYGLVSQIRRCGVGIPSNIAEGQRRGHRLEYIQLLRVAYGSGAELETQLLIASKVGYLTQPEFDAVNLRLEEIMKMLNKLLFKLKVTTVHNPPPTT